MPVDTAAIHALVSDYAVERAADLGTAFVERAREYVPRKTGALSDSIEASDAHADGDAATVTVTVGEEYGIYQDQGTGVFGPSGTRIVPLNPGGVLVWEDGGETIFARSVEGSPATKFWERTVNEWSLTVAEVS